MPVSTRGGKFIGIELDPGYFEAAKQRIEEAQAQAAWLEHPRADSERGGIAEIGGPAVTREEAIDILAESKRQNEVMRDNPSTFLVSHQNG